MPLPDDLHYTRAAAQQILDALDAGQDLEAIIAADPLLPGLVDVLTWINRDVDMFGQRYRRVMKGRLRPAGQRVLAPRPNGSHPGGPGPGGLCPAVKPGARLFKQLHRFCLLGATDDELPALLDIPKEAFDFLRATDRKFFDTIQRGRQEADARVAQSLYRRAIGYSCKEDKIFLYEGVPVVVPTTKHYPPSESAISLWLRNRQKDKWRDKTDTEVQGLVRIVASRADEDL